MSEFSSGWSHEQNTHDTLYRHSGDFVAFLSTASLSWRRSQIPHSESSISDRRPTLRLCWACSSDFSSVVALYLCTSWTPHSFFKSKPRKAHHLPRQPACFILIGPLHGGAVTRPVTLTPRAHCTLYSSYCEACYSDAPKYTTLIGLPPTRAVLTPTVSTTNSKQLAS